MFQMEFRISCYEPENAFLPNIGSTEPYEGPAEVSWARKSGRIRYFENPVVFFFVFWHGETSVE